MRKRISTHKVVRADPKRPKPRFDFFDQSQLRDLPFLDQKAGHAIGFGQKIISWFGSRGDGAHHFMGRNCLAHLLATILKPENKKNIIKNAI